MSGQNLAFSSLGASLSLSAVATTVNGVLPGMGGDAAMVSNPSTTVQLAVKFATSDMILPPVAAFNDAGSVIVGPNVTKVVGMPIGTVQVAVIGSAAGPTAVLIQRGSGGV